MSEIAAGPSVVEVEQFYAYPRERIWRALTTPELMSQWLMEPAGFEPVVGHRFTFHPDPATGFSDAIACEVVKVVTGELLAISWAPGNSAQSEGPAHWIVSWRLHPEGVGTRVILRHSGFDADDETEQLSRKIMGKGWLRSAARLGELLDG